MGLSKWLCLCTAVLASAVQAQQPDQHRLALAAGYKAAFLCSGRWNAGQDEASITRDDLDGIYPEYQPLMAGLTAKIDETARTVSVHFAESMPPRIAVWRPLLGCAQLPIGAPATAARLAPRLTPDLATPSLAATDARPWPLGDAGAVRLLPDIATQAGVDRIVAEAFGPVYGGQRTTAVIVLKDGRIIAERYRPGWTMHTPQRTWSVAKSLTATLVGRAVALGLVRTDKPAPVPAWTAPGDPRARISWDQLLRMNSGLWTNGPGNRTDEAYLGGATVSQTAATMPLEHAPGTRFNYSNNDIMLAAQALSRQVGRGALAFPFTELLWPAGMTRTVLETDWRGDFILSSQVWMTARDLARLALLYQNGGRVGTVQLLPPTWREYVARAGGAQPANGGGTAPGYGAGFWLWGGQSGLPPGTIAMNGNRGQYAVIVPAGQAGSGLVVVRRGFDHPGAGFQMARFATDLVRMMEK
jgi:CubicO group peptidase (beta-lactamase class C family)